MKTFGIGIALFLLRIIFLPLLVVSIALTPIDLVHWLITGAPFMVYDRATTVMWWLSAPLRSIRNGIFWNKIFNKDTEF